MVDSESGLGYEQSDWEQPFWERWIEEARADARAARAAQPAPQSVPIADTTDQATRSLRPKLGVYIDSEDRNSPAVYRLVNALEDSAAEYGLTVVAPDVLSDAVGEQSACSARSPVACRQALAIYPGIRALLVIRPEAAANNELAVQTQMIDADFGIDYEPMNANLSFPQEGTAGQGSEVSVWTSRVLDLAATRIAIAPWFTHSFTREGEDVYISAGRRSGLDAGAVLAVHEGGSLVRAPGGQVVGWNPGPVVGKLKVKQLIGQRMAVAESVSGRMPQPQDKLTLTE